MSLLEACDAALRRPFRCALFDPLPLASCNHFTTRTAPGRQVSPGSFSLSEGFRVSIGRVNHHTRKVQACERLRHRVHELGSPLPLSSEASQATRDLRHLSQLENWVLRATTVHAMLPGLLCTADSVWGPERCSLKKVRETTRAVWFHNVGSGISDPGGNHESNMGKGRWDAEVDG
jgi:hypothetical protein